jgi:glucokinase
MVVLGAGTGLGTVILTPDSGSGKYVPIPGEGGHSDFVAVDEFEFQVMQWLRREINQSPGNPLEWEAIVSGPGLNRLYSAVAALEPQLEKPRISQSILRVNQEDRPALIVKNAVRDRLCRKVLNLWLRSYARMAKNSALFPLAPGGVFLAGGIAPKILPHLKSGVFMKEFARCDQDRYRRLLKQTPVFVVTDERIGLFGCVNAALNFSGELSSVLS